MVNGGDNSKIGDTGVILCLELQRGQVIVRKKDAQDNIK